MADCTKCQHSKEIDRLRQICLGCAIGKPDCGLSHAGRTFISMDAARDEACRDRIVRRGMVRDQPAVLETPLAPKERDHLLQVIYMFSSLSYDEAGMVALMMQGRSLQQIATERGEKLQTVHHRWKAIVKRNKAWESLANGMIGSGRGRKPDQSETEQLAFDFMGGK